MASFSVPFVCANADSWGPPDEEDSNSNSNNSEANVNPNAAPFAFGNIAKYAALPYAPFGRSDRLGRAADFSSSNRAYQQAQAAGGGGGGGSSANMNFPPMNAYQRRGARDGFGLRRPTDSALHDQNDGDDPFQLVDTTKTATSKRFVNPASKRRQHSQRLRQINARRQQSAGGAGTASVHLDRMTGGRGGRGGPAGGRGGRAGGRGGRGGGRGGYYHNRVDRQPSVAVQADWTLLEEIDLAKLTKNLTASTTVPVPQDILWCGFLDPYNDVFDKVSARQPIPLKRMEHKEFYPVTAQDDPVLEKLAVDGEAGHVYVTDAVLAHLMTCSRSVQPWDLVIQKLPGGTLFFDKRDGSAFDFLTVQETAYQPPTDTTGVNTPERLGLEATVINQNFSQQILKSKGGRKHMDLPNPFFDEDDADGMEPASVAFRYRKFPLDDKVTVVCRTELHGIVKKTQHMTAFCLNEYTPVPVQSDSKNGPPVPTSSPQLLSWRDKIDSQRGAVLATELKNNSFKLAKWTAQSLLAGADQMKIGFVSRVRPASAAEHVILGTQFYRPTDFAQQITLQEGQLWSMVRHFVALLQKQPDTGKFVLMRHPNKAVLHLYKVPPETFEDEE